MTVGANGLELRFILDLHGLSFIYYFFGRGVDTAGKERMETME